MSKVDNGWVEGHDKWLKDMQKFAAKRRRYLERERELNAFVLAVLNKDGPDAHPDSMYAMKYSDKFRGV